MAIGNLVTHGLLGPVGFLVTHGLGSFNGAAVAQPDSGAGAGHGRRSAYLQALLDDLDYPARRPPEAAPEGVIPLAGPVFVGLESDAAARARIEAKLVAQGERQDRIAATLVELDALLAERAAVMVLDDDAIAAILMLAV